MRRPKEYLIVMKNPLVANGAEISRADAEWKISDLPQKWKCLGKI